MTAYFICVFACMNECRLAKIFYGGKIMASNNDFAFAAQFQQALQAGYARNYKKAAAILESAAPADIAENPEILLYLARAYHALGKYALAVSALNSFLTLEPESGAGWFFLGRVYLAMTSYSMAVKCLSRSLELNPDSTAALGLLGTAYLKSNRSADALKIFEQALYLDPDDKRLNQGYRNALLIEAIHTYSNGNAELAAKMFDFLIKNGMSSVLLHLYCAHSLRDLGDYQAAVEQYAAAVDLAPDDPALRWYEISVLYAMGRREEARDMLVQFGRQFPDSGIVPDAAAFGTDDAAAAASGQGTFLQMIKNAVFAGNWKSAAENGRMFIKTFGSNAVVHCFMGEAFRNLSRFRNAEMHFKKSAALDPSFPAARFGLLLTYLDCGDWDRLEFELHREAEPGEAEIDEDTKAYYAAFCAAHTEKNPKSALEKIQAVYRKHPADTALMQLLADQYALVGLFELAENWYQRLIRISEQNENAWIGLAGCYEHLGKKRDAEKTYSAYFSRWKGKPALRQKYIKLLVSLKKWKKAADETEKLLPYAVRSENVRRRLAMYRRKAGNFSAAAVLYRTILQQEPQDRTMMHQYVFCLVKCGRCADALRFLRLWHSTYTLDAEGVLIEASLCLQLCEPEQALEVLRNGKKQFPADSRIADKINAVYVKQGHSSFCTTLKN
ncbi:MAG: tetratricopeptide repeat protein [Bacteroides sp.]|nr:tetratricopeptide repeat protein [Prevotella sp.]MCM1407665.1 tetratricopeptide repeat protein [Treponema brennaborense]MCM1469185.1 tetratricopeptide repeat protein [Bacteroides sp.]